MGRGEEGPRSRPDSFVAARALEGAAELALSDVAYFDLSSGASRVAFLTADALVVEAFVAEPFIAATPIGGLPGLDEMIALISSEEAVARGVLPWRSASVTSTS